jgi:hypothetical protein
MNDRDGFSPSNETLNEMETSAGNKPSQIIDETPAATSRAGTSNTVKSEADWLKRVLRQSVLVSRISAEIRTDTDKADWDENCYKECRRLLLQETRRLGEVYGGRGAGDISVMVGWEVLRWTADALEQAKQTSNFVEDRIVRIGAERAAWEKELARRRLGVPIPTPENARRILLEAAEKDPISDAAMERVVRAAIPEKVIYFRSGEIAEACVPLAETSSGSGGGGGETGRTGETAVKLGFANQLEKATCTEDESSGAKTKNRSPASTEDRELRSRQRRTRSRVGF